MCMQLTNTWLVWVIYQRWPKLWFTNPLWYVSTHWWAVWVIYHSTFDLFGSSIKPYPTLNPKTNVCCDRWPQREFVRDRIPVSRICDAMSFVLDSLCDMMGDHNEFVNDRIPVFGECNVTAFVHDLLMCVWQVTPMWIRGWQKPSSLLVSALLRCVS